MNHEENPPRRSRTRQELFTLCVDILSCEPFDGNAVMNSADKLTDLLMEITGNTGMVPVNCETCDDTGIVCENHPDKPWGEMSVHPSACSCGAGMSCPKCCDPISEDGTHKASEAFTSRNT